MKRLTIASFSVVLTVVTIFALLSTFVLEQRFNTVSSSITSSAVSDASSSDDTGRGESAASVTVTTHTQDDTSIHVADIVLGEGETIQAALAENTYG